MATNAHLLDSLVPITQFNKGLASKIFDRLSTESQLVVLKNNKPAAVILSPKEYKRLSDAEEDLELVRFAGERLGKGWEKRAIPHKKVLRMLGISDEELAATDEPELE